MTRRVAAIDLGTNSTRLLIADVQDGRLTEVERLLTITRLGDGVDASGGFGAGSMERVSGLRAALRRASPATLGSETPYATATSAVRDARNGDASCDMLEQRCGVRARAIDGRQEARLTLRGVASGRSIRTAAWSSATSAAAAPS